MSTPPWHTAFAPATVANVGPGYDILGLALDPAMGLGDTCEVRLAPRGVAKLTIVGDDGALPTAPDENVATVAARVVLAQVGAETGFEMVLRKGLPRGSGLGSSAASAASGALAMNAALGSPLKRAALVDAGRAGENIAAGTPHPDNVVPSLLGGFLLMAEEADGSLIIQRLPVPDSLRVALVIPELEVRTADARAALPAVVPIGDAVFNASRIGLFISGLYSGDLSRIAQGVQDRLHEPYRIPLVKGFNLAWESAMAAGALGVGLSGSGPAMFALADGDAAAEACGAALAAGFERAGVSARWAAGRVSAPFADM